MRLFLYRTEAGGKPALYLGPDDCYLKEDPEIVEFREIELSISNSDEQEALVALMDFVQRSQSDVLRNALDSFTTAVWRAAKKDSDE